MQEVCAASVVEVLPHEPPKVQMMPVRDNCTGRLHEQATMSLPPFTELTVFAGGEGKRFIESANVAKFTG